MEESKVVYLLALLLAQITFVLPDKLIENIDPWLTYILNTLYKLYICLHKLLITLVVGNFDTIILQILERSVIEELLVVFLRPSLLSIQLLCCLNFINLHYN